MYIPILYAGKREGERAFVADKGLIKRKGGEKEANYR